MGPVEVERTEGAGAGVPVWKEGVLRVLTIYVLGSIPQLEQSLGVVPRGIFSRNTCL